MVHLVIRAAARRRDRAQLGARVRRLAANRFFEVALLLGWVGHCPFAGPPSVIAIPAEPWLGFPSIRRVGVMTSVSAGGRSGGAIHAERDAGAVRSAAWRMQLRARTRSATVGAPCAWGWRSSVSAWSSRSGSLLRRLRPGRLGRIGFEHAQLWDWLHVLLLPIAFGAVAIPDPRRGAGRLARRHRRAPRPVHRSGHRRLHVPWDWTGFVGNTVWDWLELVLLPLTLSILAGFQFDVRAVRGHHLLFISAFVVSIAVLAIGGYTQGWDWTGFEGNTLFDWLELLFLPVVILLVVIPLVVALRQHLHHEEPAEGEPAGAGAELGAEPSGRAG